MTALVAHSSSAIDFFSNDINAGGLSTSDMSRQDYAYAAPSAPVHVRQPSNHSTSSAFSSSANPDEDWTQISDLAERRRIQNRIAQRNYRKKLKRRLEDLERRAGSSSVSPPQAHAELPSQRRKSVSKQQQHSSSSSSCSSRQQRAAPQIASHSQFTPPMDADDGLFGADFGREGSQTPPLFAYHSYPPPDESSLYSAYPDYSAYGNGNPASMGMTQQPTAAPQSLPSMLHFADALKHDADTLNPFSLAYATLYENPHTPPLSHSFEHSTVCSEAGYAPYPGTPMSMPPSPPHMRM